MNKKPLFILFCLALAGTTVGNSVGGLMPVYAARLGANADQTGFLMSAAFTGLAAGILVAGRVPGRPGYRRALLVAAAALASLLNLLLGRVQNLSQLVPLSVGITFLEGLQIATVSILAGLQAKPVERGRVFGIIASAGTLGLLLSGLAGTVVLHWGFSGLFTAAALVLCLRALAGLLVANSPAQNVPGLAQPDIPQIGRSRFQRNAGHSTGLGRAFLFLFFASIIAFATGGIYSLARALGMMRSGFDAAAISSTIAVGGLVALPFPLLLGWLSDRIGRRSLLVICYFAGAAGLHLLAVSTQLWHIWLSSAFQTIMTASLGIGAALVTDLVPVKRLGTGLSLFNATSWIGLIIGSALSGAAIQRLGITTALVFSALLALLAILLVIPFRWNGSAAISEPAADSAVSADRSI